MSLNQPDSESETEDEAEEEEEEMEEEEEEEEPAAKEVYDDDDSDEEEVVVAKPASSSDSTAQTETRSSRLLLLPANCDSKPEGEEQEEAAVEGGPEDTAAELQPELEWRLAYSGPDRATDVRDLSPATQYHLRVCAINAAGASPYSGNVTLETPASVPGPVAALTPVDTPATSVCFKFKKPACHGERIEEYNVEWTDKVRRHFVCCLLQ